MKIPLKCISGLCDSAVDTTRHSHDWQPILPAKSPSALNQAGITAFSLTVCCRYFCSNSARSALSAAQGHTQKHKNQTYPSHIHTHIYTHAHTGEIPAWVSHPWQFQQVPQIKHQLCINCLGDHAAGNVMTGAEVKSFSWKLCGLSPPQPPPPAEMIMKSRAAMLMHRAYELKNARYLTQQYTWSLLLPLAHLLFSHIFTHTQRQLHLCLDLHIVCRLTTVLCLESVPLAFSSFLS